MADKLRELRVQLADDLFLLPSPPQELLSKNAMLKTILGHGRTIQILMNSNKNGLIVRRQPDELSHLYCNGAAQGCIYIPAPNLSKVIIIKNAFNVFDDGFLDKLIEPLSCQLQCIQKILSTIKSKKQVEPRNKLKIEVLVPVRRMKQKEAEKNQAKAEKQRTALFEKNKKIIEDNFRRDNKFQNLQINSYLFDDNQLDGKLPDSAESTQKQPDQLVLELCSFYKENLDQEEVYEMTKEEQKFESRQTSSFQNIEMVGWLFDKYFPDRHKQWATIPHINQFGDSKLYSEGNDHESRVYTGEVDKFTEVFGKIAKHSTGIFVREFAKEHLEAILDTNKLKPEIFEIDWLYLGAQKLVAFEIGQSENPDNPISAIDNKIKQSLTRTVPHMQLILYSIFQWYCQNGPGDPMLSNFEQVLELFQCIVYITNVPFEKFKLRIDEFTEFAEEQRRAGKVPTKRMKKSSNELFQLLTNNKQQLSRFVKFLFVEETSKTGPQLNLVWINENFEIKSADYSVENLFQFDKKAAENEFLKYASALISFSALSAIKLDDTIKRDDTPLDLDRKYMNASKNYTNKNKDTCDSAANRLILSPQQHGILSNKKKKYLLITGQPGTGKSTLLLAKSEQMALDETVKKIFFLYGRSRRLYGKYIKKCIDKNGSNELKAKLEIADLSLPFHTDVVDEFTVAIYLSHLLN